LLGHADIGTTVHYLHSDACAELAAVEKLEDLLARTGGKGVADPPSR
jgi:hypothetical protein